MDAYYREIIRQTFQEIYESYAGNKYGLEFDIYSKEYKIRKNGSVIFSNKDFAVIFGFVCAIAYIEGVDIVL